MHREISHADEAFHPPSTTSLYLMTGLIGLLIGIDLFWPTLAGWIAALGLNLPATRLVLGQRFALLAAVLGGARILYGSLEGLFEGKLGADLALAIACIAAILIGEPLVAAEVVFIGMVGECLESFTFERTQRAIRRIVEVCPRRCWLLRDGQEVRVLTSELKVGDRVVVKPGGRVPADGIVIEGRSAVDASALTGESLPVDRGPGDEVLAGSLNQFGALTIEARRVAEHTVVGRVIELTARALKDKAPLERTADRLARLFLPAVLALAAATFLVCFLGSLWLARPPAARLGIWEAARLSVYPTLAVLVVACPCALILATPAAIIAALGRLAGTGVLIKGGAALERLATVTAFAFDKTGTLTEGRLELGDVIGFAGHTSDEVLRAAATAEQRSEHPLARLLLREAAARQLALEPVEEFLAHPGAGVTTRSARGTMVVGTRRLLEERGIDIPEEAHARVQQLDDAGQTVLLVARIPVLPGNDSESIAEQPRPLTALAEVLGVIGARDRVRPEATATLTELRALGMQDIALLTGDRTAVARALAGGLPLTEIRAELLPQQKADFIEHWRQQQRKVAMVGDGINDAPALARADVGLAIGSTGTDVAAEAGDIVFMGDPLVPLPLLVRLSRQTVRIIRQNILIFAFGVNGLGILLTAWLWPLVLPQWLEQAPLAGVVYHQIGSFAVLLNAMRLLWFERRTPSPGLARVREGFRDVDRWLERYLNLDESLHWLAHHWRPVALGVVPVVLAACLLSGVVQIGPDEQAVVRRWGQPLDPDLGPGLHWRWPWPIESVTRVQPHRIRTVEIGFRPAPEKTGATGTAGASAMGWASVHADAVRRIPDEAVMITGDGNLIELQATVRYSIDQPRVYLFEVRDPDEVLRAAAESVLREAVAGQPFLELLTVHRERFQQEVLARLQRRCLEYGDHGLGIRLDGLSLHDLHPPQEVVPAYHNVARAMEARDRQVNEAQAEAMRIDHSQGRIKATNRRAAEALALQTVRQAGAEAHEKVTQAETARAVFLARVQSRNQLSLSQEARLLHEAAAAVRGGQHLVSAAREYQERRNEQLALQAFLTDFRLAWEGLVTVLSARSKVIVDADRLPGRRNLLLFDPEQFRPPPVLLPSTERSPRLPRSESHEGP